MQDTFVGWLRFSLLWENTPFMNTLYFPEEYRGKGYGTQFFYRKNGYVDCGLLLLPGEPLEIILLKNLATGTAQGPDS